MPHHEVSIRDWFEVLDPAGAALLRQDWDRERLRRLHGLQICVDVIAHVQNIPLRLFRVRSLQHLDETFVAFVEKWEAQIRCIITDEDHLPRGKLCLSHADAATLLREMRNPTHVATLRDWVLALAEGPAQRPANLPLHYETWFLELLPHLERDVWLTDLSNPIPAHTLARMVEHWALYVLMWGWRTIGPMSLDDDESTAILSAFGMEELGIVIQGAFARRGRSREQPEGLNDHPIGMLVGPFERELPGLSSGDDARVERAWFADRLFRFVRSAASVPGWEDIWGKVPSANELADAFASRAPLSELEVMRRLGQAATSLRLLLDTRIDPSVTSNPDGTQGRPISRANWETIAALCAWQHRWGETIRKCVPSSPILLKIPDHRISLLVQRPTGGETEPGPAKDDLLLLSYDTSDRHRRSLADCIDVQAAVLRARDPALWIELPSALLARTRERQHAAWTSHVIAINNLLTRHSRRDRPVGSDRTDDEGSTVATANCDEEDHLLRGYGGRVCQFLLQLARADVATINWLDYSVDPPQLRHVGDADRLVQHRAQRRSRLRQFTNWSLTPSKDGVVPAAAGRYSESQVYRCVAEGAIDPARIDRLAGEHGPAKVKARFDHYAEPQPQDGLSVPLLFNGRVVGVVDLESIGSIREFDTRLHTPLRRVAQLLAQAMYFQSQIWHMRRLNWLASHRPLEQWRRHDDENRYNPLRSVAHNLANIFLCPVVHIWLQDPQNPQRFKLHGYTRDSLFMPDARRLDAAPITMVPSDAPVDPVELGYPFIALAVDQWRRAPRGEEKPVGHFVQGRFEDKAVTDSEYGLQAATRGDLVLGWDFVDAWKATEMGAGSDPRRRLFVTEGLTQVMAFALVDTSAVASDPVGIVTLHSPSSPQANAQPPWPPGWRPVVAHVQTYMLYVLMQTETIANPLDNLRRYLLHEGRNELNGVAIMVARLRSVVKRLVAPDPPAGHLRPWLRTTLPDLRRRAQRGNGSMGWLSPVVSELQVTERMLDEVARTALPLLSPDRAENFGVLARLIEVQRDLASVGHADLNRNYDHETEWLNLRHQVVDALSHYEAIFKAAGIWIDHDDLPAKAELLTSPVLWRWMLSDLSHNLGKYALPNTIIRFALLREGDGRDRHRLCIQNVSTYDPDRDRPDRLMLHGVQGSAGLHPPRELPANARISRKGTGIGVWGVSVLAKVLDMEFDISVKPAGTQMANYSFDLLIPRRLVRRH
jgi:hypothetical protein